MTHSLHFILWLYCVKFMVNDHSARKEMLLPSHKKEQEIAQWVHHEGSIRQPIAP